MAEAVADRHGVGIDLGGIEAGPGDDAIVEEFLELVADVGGDSALCDKRELHDRGRGHGDSPGLCGS